ncbi:MAG: class II aldolase/adducin family protein [Candidatus Lokiarchaeota archaeon]|nr:class II aldolase/adducin family protein [Candidatus Lokiarchaeota archaeon]
MHMNSILKELLEYSGKLSKNKLVIGPGGNTSCRLKDKLYIKPSGLNFEEMKVDDFVEVDIETGVISERQKRKKPSSEILMHRYIYQKRPDVMSIFHAHPPITIGLAASGTEFKHLYPDSAAYLGKEILVLDYIVPTTYKLAEYVRDKIENYVSIVLQNHGAITVAKNPKTAYLRMELLEGLAYSLWIALSSNPNGKIRYLTDQEVDEVINLDAEKYRTKLYDNG